MVQILRQTQNLLKQVPLSTIERPAGFYKAIVLDVLSVVSGIGLGYFYKLYLDANGSAILFIAILTVFLVLNVINTLLTKNFSRRVLIILLESLGIVVLFYEQPVQIFVISLASIILFLLWGEVESRREIRNSLRLRFFKFAVINLKKSTTGLVIALVILYIPAVNINNNFFSENIFKGLFDWSTKLADNFSLELEANSSFQNLAESIIRLQSERDSDFKLLSPSQQDQVISQGTQKLIDNVSEFFGKTVSPDKPAREVIYEYLNTIVKNTQNKFGAGFSFIWAIVLIVAIRSIAIFYYIIVGILSLFVYYFLLALNFVQILSQSQSQEIIDYS